MSKLDGKDSSRSQRVSSCQICNLKHIVVSIFNAEITAKNQENVTVFIEKTLLKNEYINIYI